MKKTVPKSTARAVPLPKCPTGIQGLDEITGGGAQLFTRHLPILR